MEPSRHPQRQGDLRRRVARVVVNHESTWLDEDQQAALEWLEWKDSLCPGCGHDRRESFDPRNEDAYDTEVLKCFVCAERERTAHKLNVEREAKAPPFGLFYVVHGPVDGTVNGG